MPTSLRLCPGLPVFSRYNSPLLYSLVLHYVRQTPRRTLLSVVAIGIEVMSILMLAGIKYKELPPELKFTDVVISLLLSVVITVSFIYVVIGRYAAVLERTHDIGIFRFLGASPTCVFSLLFQESLFVAISGTTVGIAMTYGAKWFMTHVLSGVLTYDLAYMWWPIAGVIAAASDALGAILPSSRAVNQDVIQALSQKETDAN